jgi:hypothetical protein
VAPVALRMLALADGAEVEVRRVHEGTLGARRADGASADRRSARSRDPW